MRLFPIRKVKMNRTDNKKTGGTNRKIGKKLTVTVCILIALLLIAGGLLVIFSPKAVMEYGGVKVDREMYSYWLSYFKKELMAEYKINGSRDTEVFWESEFKDGVSYGEYFGQMADERIKAKIVAANMYDSFGQELPDYAVEDINAYLAELIDFVGEGSKKTLEDIAAEYGTDYEAIKRVAVCDYKAELLFNLTYGADGSYITAEEKDAYYKDNFSRVKVIFIRTKDENLSQSELDEKNKMIEQLDLIFEESVNEARFDSLMGVYSDDNASAYYKNGFYLSHLSDYPVEEVTAAALSMETGELKKIESDYGVHYILKLELDEKAYENEDNSDWFNSFNYDASLEIFDKAVKEKTKEVKVNEREKCKVSFAKIKYNYEIKPLMS